MIFSIFKFKLIFLGILSTRQGVFSVPTGHSRVKFDIKRPRLNLNLQSLGSRREKGPDENVYLSPPSSDYGRDNNGKREDCFAALSPTSPIRVVDKLLENPAYEMESVLGEGAYGVVYRAKRTRDGSTVCVKKMRKLKISELHLDPRSGEINEVFILRLCQHPNIIKYLDYFEGVGDIFLVLEHVSDSEDLFFFIEHNSPLREEASKTIFHQIAWALHYLHHCGITHGDIKDENILINKNDGRVKLIDFGSSFITSHRRMVENGLGRYCFAGTIEYASPEITSGTFVVLYKIFYENYICRSWRPRT